MVFEFKTHSDLKGLHALFSGSKPSWINYDDEKCYQAWVNSKKAKEGTRLHALAEELIRLNIKLPKTRETLNQYVNDCIGFHMQPEQTLKFSDNFFGTADAICYRNDTLRIFDLKTGVGRVNPNQLCVYAALFFLEYKKDPYKTKMELRIYQNNDVAVYEPDPKFIEDIMEKIRHFDSLIEDWNEVN